MSKLVYSKTNKSTGKVRFTNKDYPCLPEKAKWLLYENQIKLHTRMPIKKRTETYVYSGVESLKYLGPARKYIENRYNINTELLDVFLYLYPYNYFTKSDYTRIAKPFIKIKIDALIRNEYIVRMFKKEELKRPGIKPSKVEDIFALSLNAKRAVTYFYRIISGDMKPYQFKHTKYSKNPTADELLKEMLEEMCNKA